MTLPAPPQILADLRGTFHGALRFDVPTRTAYASDAGAFEVMPYGVALPRDEADLRGLAAYAHENGVSLVPRGAGTGLAGESLGPGLIVDLSAQFRRVRAIGPDWVTAEAGVTLTEVNTALAPTGRRFAPDPASAATCTLGGMVGTNASGSTAYRHGYTRDHVLGLRAVWDDGTADDLSRHRPQGRNPTDPSARLIELRSQTAALLAANRDLIQLTRPQSKFNRCGYVLHDVLTPAGLDLARLLVGTEGTLAFITEVTLRTIPRAGGSCLAVLGFATIDEAVRAGLSLRSADGVVGCDLFDQRLLALSRVSDPGSTIGVSPAIGAALILTLEADTEAQVESLGRTALDCLRDTYRAGVLAVPSCDPAALARVRRFRSSAVGTMTALGSGPRPVPCIEDVAVPAEELPRFLTESRALLQKAGVTASVLVHVLAGQVHTRPFVDLNNPTDREKLWPLAEAVHGLALALGGTVSTQHGTGIARTPWVEKQYGHLMPVFRELKRVFDPKNVLNPGKIVGPDPSRPAWPLRGSTDPAFAPSRIPTVPAVPLLIWRDSPRAEASKCNGCGDCRAPAPVRMCPVFHATQHEVATPRAKANLVRPQDGHLRRDDDDTRLVAGLCVNCKMCRDECRAGVNVPKLMLEVKAAHYAARAFGRGGWLQARAEGLTTVGGVFPHVTNLMLGSRTARWIIEKLVGLSRLRTMQRFTHRTFLRRARKAGLTTRQALKPAGALASLGTDTHRLDDLTSRPVAYFVDTFANFNDPLIGDATVAVLRRHGVEVHVPRRQRGSGMAALVQGDVDAARDTARYNLRTLADLVREGYLIVCSEPTAVVAITQDYLDLLDDPDARLVAAHTMELSTYLWRRYEVGRLRTDFRPLDLTVGHHVPCHVKALRGPIAGPRLLELIPSLRVHTIDVSCSGMAGTYGLMADTREVSLAAGRPMLHELDRPRVLLGSTECSACRMQMQEGTRKRTLHPVQYLAVAYGLLPELETKMTRPLGRLLTD